MAYLAVVMGRYKPTYVYGLYAHTAVVSYGVEDVQQETNGYGYIIYISVYIARIDLTVLNFRRGIRIPSSYRCPGTIGSGFSRVRYKPDPSLEDSMEDNDSYWR